MKILNRKRCIRRLAAHGSATDLWPVGCRISSLNMGEKVMREINILKLFMHPHIIRLYEACPKNARSTPTSCSPLRARHSPWHAPTPWQVIETATEIFLFVEYAPGGELFDLIVECEKLPEAQARRFFQQVAPLFLSARRPSPDVY